MACMPVTGQEVWVCEGHVKGLCSMQGIHSNPWSEPMVGISQITPTPTPTPTRTPTCAHHHTPIPTKHLQSFTFSVNNGLGRCTCLPYTCVHIYVHALQTHIWFQTIDILWGCHRIGAHITDIDTVPPTETRHTTVLHSICNTGACVGKAQ